MAELAKQVTILDEEEQRMYIGGGYESCVFNFFDYLDGNRLSSGDYYWATMTFLGYTPDNNGGVPTDDIWKIGSFGGFSVNNLDPPFGIIPGGTTRDGDHILMVFNSGDTGHAVLVTGAEICNGEKRIYYYDPTNKTSDYKIQDECTMKFFDVHFDSSIPVWPSAPDWPSTSGNSGDVGNSGDSGISGTTNYFI